MSLMACRAKVLGLARRREEKAQQKTKGAREDAKTRIAAKKSKGKGTAKLQASCEGENGCNNKEVIFGVGGELDGGVLDRIGISGDKG